MIVRPKPLRRPALLVIGILTAFGLLAVRGEGRWVARRLGVVPRETVASRLAALGPGARAALAPHFARAGVPYPGQAVMLVGLKAERRVEVYAADTQGQWHFVRAYDVTAASGHAGPKLLEGDRQVPEGLYGVESLNPNSRFHLALRVDYPNAWDRAQAAREGRTALGGDIMVHGGRASIGCLALGDAAIEEVFVLAADVGRERVRVLIAPQDFRRAGKPTGPAVRPWVPTLYAIVDSALRALPLPLPDSGRVVAERS